MKTLPTIPSELIKVALRDLISAEQSETCVVNMDIWHSPLRDGRLCHLCLAGSVMRGLGVKDTVESTPSQLDADVQQQLYALNELRTGRVSNYMNHMHYSMEYCKLDSDDIRHMHKTYVEYAQSPNDFKEWLANVANILEKKGF